MIAVPLFLKAAWASVKASPMLGAALKYGAIALGVLLVFLKVRQAGKDSARREMAEEIVDRGRIANEARTEVRNAADRGKPPPRKVDKFYID
jgi:uncharacterized membrane protein YdjX (TVP38/TMEM64 family)